MTIYELIDYLRGDTLDVSLPSFGPELALCATIVLMLLARIPAWGRKVHALAIALPGVIVALLLAAPWQHLVPSDSLPAGPIAAISAGTDGAIRVNAPAHGLEPGQAVRLEGVPGVGGAARVARAEADAFELAGTKWTGKYAGGGTFAATTDLTIGREIFDGLLVYDTLTVYFRSLLLVFAILFLVFTALSGIPDREDSVDFYTLVLGGTVGMCLMASANHLLIVFLGVEMASVPSYALAGMLKGRKSASEAALKYAVYGAGAAGVMLYGISLLAGALGSVHIPTMASQLAALTPELLAERQTVLMAGGLMVMVGLAFKLSAVPFHFWCPDVFEGACAEVNAFLSVASKAAALALLIRVALGFSHAPAPATPAAAAPQAHAAIEMPAARDAGPRLVLAAYRAAAADPAPAAAPASATAPAQPAAPPATTAAPPAAPAPAPAAATPAAAGTPPAAATPPAATATPKPAAAAPTAPAPAPAPPAAVAAAPAPAELTPIDRSRRFIAGLIALLAAVTCTFGNLAAYGQTNIKRLLAYSTIAHAGYLMMPVAAAVSASGSRPEVTEQAVAAVAFYTGAYLFMNLGAFALVAFLRNTLRSEEIADYAGLIRRSPLVVICFGSILFSLIGLPPFSGFIAKLLAFAALAASGDSLMISLLIVGGLNTVLSLFYYLRVVRVMTIDDEPAGRLPFEFSMFSPEAAYVALITLPVLVLGVWWDPLHQWAQAAAARMAF